MIPETYSPAEQEFNRRRQTFGLIGGPIIAFWNGLMNGQYELLIPGLLCLLGMLVMMVGWFGVSSIALEDNIVQGIASLITLGLYTPIYGTAHYRTCKYQMEMYWYGYWCTQAGLASMVMIAGFYDKVPLLMVPISIYYVGAFVSWFGLYRVLLAAFDDSAKQGYLSMFVPFYVLVFGATRWNKCKVNMIVGIVGIVIAIIAGIVFGVMLASSTVRIPSFKEMFPAAQLG